METIIQQLLLKFDDLKGFEGFYKINKEGELWSCIQNKLMKKQTTEDGYYFYNLKNGLIQKNSIHRLLAKQYIPNPDNLPEIDHIDRNKINNSLDNLRWVNKTTQNNNKTTNIVNMTEEKKEERITDLKEYKRKWAEKNRRENGIEEKKKLTIEEKRAYQAEWMRLKRASLTQEERDAINAKKRETRKQKSS